MSPELKAEAIELVEREGALIDARDWDAWLALYTEDAEYWIPSWNDEYTLVEDPHTDISLIWYGSRHGLEDRVYRIRTQRSLASQPLPRTVHQVTNFRVEPGDDGMDAVVHSHWATHSYRRRRSHTFFGHQTHWLRREEGELRIARRHIIVANDAIPSLLDVYSV